VTVNSGTFNYEVNTVPSVSDLASKYVLRRDDFLPVVRRQSQNWTLEKLENVGRGVPEIRVTPATDERRRRRFPAIQTSTATSQSQPRPRDYDPIYAWSSELAASGVMKRSATFGDEWHPVRSDANGYIEPAGCRSTPRAERTDTEDWVALGRRVVGRTSCSQCGDFVDMRGVCRAVVSAADLLQIELFYRSNKTEVISCACAARLYFAHVRRNSSTSGGSEAAALTQPKATDSAARWYPTTAVGVPVIVLDCGGSRCRDRKLKLVLAEVGSGFALWRDTVDHLTCYRAVSADFHSLRFSHDHTRLAGLRFADRDAADAFGRQLDSITGGPAGSSLLNLSADRRVAKLADADFRSSCYPSHPKSPNDTKSGTKYGALQSKLKKCDISGPCCFEHITKFEAIPGFLV